MNNYYQEHINTDINTGRMITRYRAKNSTITEEVSLDTPQFSGVEIENSAWSKTMFCFGHKDLAITML